MPVLATSKHRRQQQGFTLIEVLIAIVLLAIGLLSMAQMQANGLRANHGAYLRSQATILAGDILDSMRANVTTARSGGYNIDSSADPNNPPTPNSGNTTADTDVSAWLTNLITLLPSGAGIITNNGATLSVTVLWSDSRQNEGTTTRSFLVDSTL